MKPVFVGRTYNKVAKDAIYCLNPQYNKKRQNCYGQGENCYDPDELGVENHN
jgi:hypothetical protein